MKLEFLGPAPYFNYTYLGSFGISKYFVSSTSLCFCISCTELPYKLISQGVSWLKTFLKTTEFKLLPLVIEHWVFGQILPFFKIFLLIVYF